METCGFKLPLQRSGAEPALCSSRSDDLRQRAVPLGMGLFQTFKSFNRYAPFVGIRPFKQFKPFNRFAPFKSLNAGPGNVQTFKDRSGRRTYMFREFSKCRTAAMVNFFRSVKLVRDLGDLGKSGTRERFIIERAITPSALCPLPVRNEFRPGILWRQRSG
jgi:hypothetical protein